MYYAVIYYFYDRLLREHLIDLMCFLFKHVAALTKTEHLHSALSFAATSKGTLAHRLRLFFFALKPLCIASSIRKLFSIAPFGTAIVKLWNFVFNNYYVRDKKLSAIFKLHYRVVVHYSNRWALSDVLFAVDLTDLTRWCYAPDYIATNNYPYCP